MNTEERIESHLKATTSHLVAEDRLEEVMKEGRRRQIRARTARGLGAAAGGAGFVGVLSVLGSPPGDPTVATDPTTVTAPPETPATTLAPEPTTTVVPSAEPSGVIVADADGITVLDREGNTLLELAQDGPYTNVAWAAPDLRGGIVFQHETTPMPWEQGTILRLEAGATEPSVVVSPPPGSGIVPVGTGMGEAGQALLYYLADTPTDTGSESRLTTMDLDTGQTRDLGMLEPNTEVTAGGPVVATIQRGDCVQVSFTHIADGPISSPVAEECLPIATGVSVSADGRAVATLDGGELTVRAITSGDTLWRRSVPGAYMATSGEAGWAVRTPEETVLVSQTGARSLPPVESGWVVPYANLDVSYDAGLGGEDAALPCRPQDAALPPQDLPPAVAETRERLAALAASCDYDGLAAIVETDGTTLSFGDVGDPVEFWVAEGRRGEDPLGLLAALLTTTPAHDPESDYWAWPAAHVDPSDEASWTELEPILGTETVATLRQAVEGYLGWRVGIAADGTWWFYVAGD